MRGISCAILFGSRATGTTHAKSDTDIALITDHPLTPRETASIAYVLSEEIATTVEVIDVRIAPPALLRSIARDGVLLYEREPRIFARFRMYAFKRYMEAKPLFALRRASRDTFTAAV